MDGKHLTEAQQEKGLFPNQAREQTLTDDYSICGDNKRGESLSLAFRILAISWETFYLHVDSRTGNSTPGAAILNRVFGGSSWAFASWLLSCRCWRCQRNSDQRITSSPVNLLLVATISFGLWVSFRSPQIPDWTHHPQRLLPPSEVHWGTSWWIQW